MKETHKNFFKRILIVAVLIVLGGALYLMVDERFSTRVEKADFPVQNVHKERKKKNQNNKESTQSNPSTEVQIKKKNKIKGNNEKYKDLSWKDLVQLDYKTGEKKGNLKEFENQLVKIPGYIVPLTDEYTVLEEFLFVPNDQACIHVPPPPPNLIIRAKLSKKLPFEKVFNPSWLLGKLEIVTTKSQYGDSGYKIDGASLIKYEFDD